MYTLDGRASRVFECVFFGVLMIRIGKTEKGQGGGGGEGPATVCRTKQEVAVQIVFRASER